MADAPPGLQGVADISYEDDLVFVGGWARKGLQEWHVVEAVFNAVGTRPASTFPCQKKGLILKFSNPILVARILEMGLFAEGHKLVVGPVRKPVKKLADSSSSDADVESVLIEVRKCTSKPTVRNAGSQTVLTGVALRTIIDGLHSDLKFLTGCLGSMSEGDPPDARSLTSRCSQPHWTLASTLDPAQRGKPDSWRRLADRMTLCPSSSSRSMRLRRIFLQTILVILRRAWCLIARRRTCPRCARTWRP